MRKLLMALLLVVSAIALTACGGDDSSNNNSNNGSSVTNVTIADNGTWQIYTAQGLKDFATEANTNPTTNAMLMNDINLAGSESNQWTAIVQYIGTFNGDNKTIAGLYINSTSNYQGLFGASSGIIKNVIISAPNVTGGQIVGGVVGENNGGTVENVAVIGGTINGANYVGGVVGGNIGGGTIKAVYNTGAVSGTYGIGGVVSHNEGTVTASYNTGAVSAINNLAGGVVGMNASGGTVTAVYNTGAVSGTNNVGGVVGLNDGGTVNTAYFLKGKVAGDNGIGSDPTNSNTSVQGVATVSEILVSVLNGVIGNEAYIFVAGANGPTTVANDPSCINPANSHDSSSGTWQIYNAEGLKAFATEANTNLTANATLMCNINLEGNDSNQWTPIGTSANRYAGTFNGDNKTIAGLYIDSTSNDQGLFGASSGTIKNAILSAPNVTGATTVGGGVGDNSGTVENVAVIGGTINGIDSVGGVVGYNSGTITAVYNAGAVSAIVNLAGGVIGASSGTIKAVYNTGAVSGSSYVGGVIGANLDGTVTASYNTGAVSGTATIGGVVGWHAIGTVTAVYNTGAVSGTNDVGGVVGLRTSGTINTAYFLNGKVAGDIGIGSDPTNSNTSVQGVATVSEILVSVLNGVIGNEAYIFVAGANGPTLAANDPRCINPANSHDSSSGTWQIYNAEGLKAFATEANTNLTANATLMCNINLEGNDSNQWTAIGTYANKYSGTFNGDNKTIAGLYINNTSDYQGLFGASSGTIKNAIISAPNVTGGQIVGGVVGENSGGTVENVAVIGGTIKGSDNIGGVVGANVGGGTIKAVYNTCAVSGTNSIGGVVSHNEGTVTASYNTGAVSATNNSAGGVVSDNRGTVTAVYNTGEVSGTNNVGGVVGDNRGTITATGTVNTAYFLNGKVAGDIGIGGGSGTASNLEGVADIEALNGKVDTMNSAIGSNREYEYKPGTDQTKDLPTLIKVVNP